MSCDPKSHHGKNVFIFIEESKTRFCLMAKERDIFLEFLSQCCAVVSHVEQSWKATFFALDKWRPKRVSQLEAGCVRDTWYQTGCGCFCEINPMPNIIYDQTGFKANFVRRTEQCRFAHCHVKKSPNECFETHQCGLNNCSQTFARNRQNAPTRIDSW